MATENFIEFNIRKRFTGFDLDCEASFGPGVTAIFGPSGTGKTTLLNCLAGMAKPDEGSISVDGRTVFSSESKTDVRPEKRRFGYVFQDSVLFPHKSVRDNIQYGYNLTPVGSREIDLDHLVDMLGLSPLMSRNVKNLSGGEKQRVALARALAISPKLLLMDEPLASLDARFKGTIISYLKRIVRELKIPMVFVSHSLSEVTALSDDTLAIEGGRTVAFGPTRSLLGSPALAAVADYAALENILEGEALPSQDGASTSRIRVGEAELLIPAIDAAPGDAVMVSVRAGDIILSLEAPQKISARNIVKAVVREIHDLGSQVLVFADVGERITVEITPGALADLSLRVGSDVYLVIKTNSITVMS
ncbi:MAG: molybdenum ABC transporter ATP-binding protein [Dehalococcoidia bacterium]|nr:MAG: molybdenum ABC transporter ATP-binding protein [Dehalococcoidia bacterium]